MQRIVEEQRLGRCKRVCWLDCVKHRSQESLADYGRGGYPVVVEREWVGLDPEDWEMRSWVNK